jgi:hypothetical protein
MSYEQPSGIQGHQKSLAQQSSRAEQLQNSSYYKDLQQKLAQQAPANAMWSKGVDAKGATTYYINASHLAAQTDFSIISSHDHVVKAPLSAQVLKAGMKIDIESKTSQLVDSFIKNVIQSKSHNLIVSKLAALKASAIGFLLSMFGMSSEDIRKLKKQAFEKGRNEVKQMYTENQYNLELLNIVGNASNKQHKAQVRVLEEMTKQLSLQAVNLGMADYFTVERKLEIRIDVCKEILNKFKEEQMNLKYELEYVG